MLFRSKKQKGESGIYPPEKMKRELGKLLKGVREEQKIEKEDLCSGLCTVEELDRIEAGEDPEVELILLQALFERAGTSLRRFLQ